MEDNTHKGAGQGPFHTTDAILAFSLYLAGVPFFDDQKPCLHWYNKRILAKLGFGGMTLEQAARKAMETKKKGHLEYAFKRTAELNYLLKVYKEQEQFLQSGEGTAMQVVHDLLARGVTLGNGAISAAMVVRLACVILKMRVQFVDLWQQIVPYVQIHEPGEVRVHEGGMRQTFPGFKLVPLNASPELRKKMKV